MSEELIELYGNNQFEEVKEVINTVEGAQAAIDLCMERTKEILSQPNISGESIDNFEPVRYELEPILALFRFATNNLPEEVECVSVRTRFNKVSEASETNRDRLLRQLQNLLKVVDPDALEQGEEVSYEFVVKPPFMPEVLKTSPHGSGSRSLAQDVVETFRHNRVSQINLLEIKPHGEPGGSTSEISLYAVNYHIPLMQIERVVLEREQKPLTPYLKRSPTSGELEPVDISY